MNKLCVSIFVEDYQKAEKILVKYIDEIDLIEYRFDNIIYPERMKKIIDSFNKDIILTIRTLNEGGMFNGGKRELLSRYMSLLKLRPNFIDIGISTGIYRNLLDKARENGIKIIGSYHDVKGTPDKDELQIIYQKIHETKPDIIKIVTTARSIQDNLVILNFLKEVNSDIPMVAFCMGKKGKLSRIASPYLGSYITYVSIDGGGTAKGQLTIEEYLLIRRILND